MTHTRTGERMLEVLKILSENPAQEMTLTDIILEARGLSREGLRYYCESSSVSANKYAINLYALYSRSLKILQKHGLVKNHSRSKWNGKGTRWSLANAHT